MEINSKIFGNKLKLIAAGSIMLAFGAGFSLGIFKDSLGANSTNNDTPIKTAEQYANFADSAAAAPVKTSSISKFVAPSKDAAKSGAACPVKGKPSKTGKNIYYVPGNLAFNRLKNPTCFSSEKEAQSQGYVKATR